MDLVGSLALCAVLLALGLAAALAVAVAGRRRLEDELQAVRADLRDLRKRLDTLVEPVETGPRPLVDPVETRPATEYLITTLPTEGPEEATPISSGQFVSVAVGESMVRIVSLAYGVGRALSPQQRNRIRFEMGREVKRSRRQRRRDLKDARRDLRTRGSTGPRPDLAEDAA
ncbi:MAG: hypothetical protein QOF53_453 [Nocardioidaceae bacterium]|jgi:hypothetical protein|nr:hypothetical protein [Nocardioidaceae bacterium]